MSKVIGVFIGCVIVAAVLFGIVPLLPALISDLIKITWATMPWQGKIILILIALGVITLIARVIWGIVHWVARPIRRYQYPQYPADPTTCQLGIALEFLRRFKRP